MNHDPAGGAPSGTGRSARHGGLAALTIGALGIVYGDIGTSPLYAFRETFHHAHLTVDKTNAYGAASVVLWSLIVVIAFKYISLVMKADNKGEGGILALTALLIPRRESGNNRRAALAGGTAALITLGIVGTALLYGDGLITPAISVLSAVEGFEQASDALEDFVVPIAIAILVGLFAVQRRGTGGIAKVFGPVMVLWFVVISVLGVAQIAQHPGVLSAVSPHYAVRFFLHEPGHAFIGLGSLFLVLTGGEALYADMGHFGRRPIKLSWFGLVMPAMVLNYFGQAALVTDDAEKAEHPFFNLAPDWAVAPIAVLATMATVIASQALISGAFSLTKQAIQLDYIPRLTIKHTSSEHEGQIYVPLVNWLLMIGCVALVLGFRTSSNLAAAYGIAVTATMAITTVLFYQVARTRFGWSQAKALTILTPLLLVDLAFFAANVPKIPDGGWFPLVVAAILVIQMTTWRRGRDLVAARVRRAETPMAEFVVRIRAESLMRVSGTAVYLFKDADAVPPAMMLNVEHQKVLHERALVVVVEVSQDAYSASTGRLRVTDYGAGIGQVVIRHGFMEDSDVIDALRSADVPGGPVDPDTATFFVGDELVIAGEIEGMHPWREELYVFLDRGAESATRFFKLPPARTIAIGTHVEI